MDAFPNLDHPPRSRRLAPRALRERLECSEGGTRDAGRHRALPTRPRSGLRRPSVQLPTGDRMRSGGVIGKQAQNARRPPHALEFRGPCRPEPSGARLTAAFCGCLSARFVDSARVRGERDGMGAAFVFPGQGSQSVGMGKALADNFPVARQVFDEVDAALGVKLSAIIFEGPAEMLTLTENAQPALMAVSLAVTRVLEAETGLDLGRDARFVAGHSLGEYSALAAAGTFSIQDAAQLLRIRGRTMQKAVPVGIGAMAALIGLDFDAAAAVAAEAAQGEVCQAANDNGGGQVVVSGHKAAVERAVAIAKNRGARRAMLLPVSAPFHCTLMQPAAAAMAEALAKVTIRPPVVPVVANISAQPLRTPEEIVQALIAQVTGTVRWRESVLAMAEAGVARFYEIGAGKVLSGLIKRIVEDAKVAAIGSPEEVAAFKAGRMS